MKRAYFATEDLQELENIEAELEQKGIASEHMHVLTQAEADASERDLHPVHSILRRDVVHQGIRGALVGGFLATLLVTATYALGLHQTAGSFPYVLLALFIMGFCTWEGGLIGMQKNNYKFERFRSLLRQGWHVFFVDYREPEAVTIRTAVSRHPRLRAVGDGSSLVNPFSNHESR